MRKNVFVAAVLGMLLAGCMTDADFNSIRVGDKKEEVVARFGEGKSQSIEILGVSKESTEYRGMLKAYQIEYLMGRVVAKATK